MLQKDSVDIFSYAHPVHYLKEVFLVGKKQRRHSFRLKTLSTKAGFKSPSTISMALNGRRDLTQSAAEKLAKALSLSGRRRNYFLAITKYQLAKTVEERAEAQEEMLRLRATSDEKLIEMKQYRVFANWYYIALFVLAGMKNIDWAHSTLAATLGNEITEEQVGAALVDLCEVGLLKKNGGRYERISNRLTTAEDLRSGAMFRYHKQMISMADKALELPLEQREMNAITIGIAKRRLPELKEKIRKFRKEINEIFTPDEADAEQVYQLNLHLFPITKPIAPLKEGKV